MLEKEVNIIKQLTSILLCYVGIGGMELSEWNDSFHSFHTLTQVIKFTNLVGMRIIYSIPMEQPTTNFPFYGNKSFHFHLHSFNPNIALLFEMIYKLNITPTLIN